MTRVVTWVRNSEIDSSVANSAEEEVFESFSSADDSSIFTGAEAFDDALPPTFKQTQEESPKMNIIFWRKHLIFSKISVSKELTWLDWAFTTG